MLQREVAETLPHHFEKRQILNINENPEAQSYALFKTPIKN